MEVTFHSCVGPRVCSEGSCDDDVGVHISFPLCLRRQNGLGQAPWVAWSPSSLLHTHSWLSLNILCSSEAVECINFWCLKQFNLSKEKGLNFIFLLAISGIIRKAWAVLARSLPPLLNPVFPVYRPNKESVFHQRNPSWTLAERHSSPLMRPYLWSVVSFVTGFLLLFLLF